MLDILNSRALPISNWVVGDYWVSRFQEDIYIPNVNAWLGFLATYGQFSPNIFDYDSDGVVGTNDLLTAKQNYGKSYQGDITLDSIKEGLVLGQFSSGWIVQLEDWEVSFLKVTPYDDGGEFIPDPPLKSFFIEGVYKGVQTKIWFYKG